MQPLFLKVNLLGVINWEQNKFMVSILWKAITNQTQSKPFICYFMFSVPLFFAIRLLFESNLVIPQEGLLAKSVKKINTWWVLKSSGNGIKAKNQLKQVILKEAIISEFTEKLLKKKTERQLRYQ